mmetsp:Transcript_47845/g.101658  ORF Transcript_47845/g.101658 Transcript_47845/m.101658 type:complete len:208 (-) Transcript_47845:67-690(-)
MPASRTATRVAAAKRFGPLLGRKLFRSIAIIHRPTLLLQLLLLIVIIGRAREGFGGPHRNGRRVVRHGGGLRRPMGVVRGGLRRRRGFGRAGEALPQQRRRGIGVAVGAAAHDAGTSLQGVHEGESAACVEAVAAVFDVGVMLLCRRHGSLCSSIPDYYLRTSRCRRRGVVSPSTLPGLSPPVDTKEEGGRMILRGQDFHVFADRKE